MASPVSGLNQGNGIDQFKGIVQQWIREEITRAQAGGAGTIVDAQGNVFSQGFDGTFTPATAGTTGWGLAKSGNAIFNNLTLRGSIIGNDALTNPVIPSGENNYATNFALTTTMTEVVGWDVTVPAGCTQMASFTTGSISAINGSASLDYLTAQVWIGSYYGDTFFAPASGSGGSCHVSTSKQGLLAGLTPGSTIRFALKAHTSSNTWPANASTIADVVSLILWLR